MAKREKDLSTRGRRLRAIRKKLGLSQEQLAESLDLTQGTLSQLENDHHELGIEKLRLLAEKFEVDCDWYISGRNSMFFRSDADSARIPLVHRGAVDGYIEGAVEGASLEELAFYRIPGFIEEGEYRIFEIEGDNMEPTLEDGDFVVCEFTVIDDMKSSDLCVLVGPRSVWVKRFESRSDGKISLSSDNSDYPVQSIDEADVREIWRIRARITRKIADEKNLLEQRLRQLEETVRGLEGRLRVDGE